MKRFSKYYIFVICFIIVLFLFSGVAFASSVLSASSFKYAPASSSTITSNNVKGALDELYTKANSISGSVGKVNSVTYDYLNQQNPDKNASGTDYKTLGHRIFRATNGSQESLCLYSNNSLNCFDTNNYVIEVEHLKRIFKDANSYIATSEGEYGEAIPSGTFDYSHDFCITCSDSVCFEEYIQCRKMNYENDYCDYEIYLYRNGGISITDCGEDNTTCNLYIGEEFDCTNMP